MGTRCESGNSGLTARVEKPISNSSYESVGVYEDPELDLGCQGRDHSGKRRRAKVSERAI